MKKHLGKIIGIGAIAVIIILCLFYYLNNRSDGIFEKKGSSTEAELILSKNLDSFYPSNQREVVRMFYRINKCCYNEKISDEQYEQLLDQLRKLFDKEFLEANPREKQRTAFYDELTLARQSKRIISITKVQKQSQVKEWTDENGNEFSSIIGCMVETEKGKKAYDIYYEFLLRKDSEGKWKIVGWQLGDKVDIEE